MKLYHAFFSSYLQLDAELWKLSWTALCLVQNKVQFVISHLNQVSHVFRVVSHFIDCYVPPWIENSMEVTLNCSMLHTAAKNGAEVAVWVKAAITKLPERTFSQVIYMCYHANQKWLWKWNNLIMFCCQILMGEKWSNVAIILVITN